MIANNNGHGEKRSSLYSGYNPVIDEVSDRNASLDTAELFDVSDEIAVKQARVVEWLQLEQAAREKDKQAAMSVGAMTDKAVDAVLKAKQIGAAINNSGIVWNDHKAKRFVMRIINLLESALIDHPEIFNMLMRQLEGVRQSFVTVEASTYTPDSDLRLMDDTIPAR